MFYQKSVDIFILKFRQKYTIERYVCLFVSHNHTGFFFLEGFVLFCFVVI